MSDQPSLLPPNATSLERALEQATLRVGSVQVPLRELWNPNTCPDSLLPWLAWAFSVDVWDATWTEAQRRAAIAASITVHREKGTIGALRSALDALGYDIDVTEWHQKTPAGAPYTFRVDLTVEQVGIPSSAAYDRIIEVADSVKNLRSQLEGVGVRALSRGGEYFAARCYMGEIVNLSAEPSA